MKILNTFLLVVLLLVSACAKEPEGPAEAIGKGIDQISRGLQAIPADDARGARRDEEYRAYRDDADYDDNFGEEYRRDRSRYNSDREYCIDFPERCRDRYRY